MLVTQLLHHCVDHLLGCLADGKAVRPTAFRAADHEAVDLGLADGRLHCSACLSLFEGKLPICIQLSGHGLDRSHSLACGTFLQLLDTGNDVIFSQQARCIGLGTMALRLVSDSAIGRRLALSKADAADTSLSERLMAMVTKNGHAHQFTPCCASVSRSHNAAAAA